MEIHFQQQPKAAVPMKKTTKFKGRSRSNSNKYVGVRQRPSGRWVAEIKDTTQKIRMWLGTFETAEEAARAYDEAACLLRGSNTRTNFVTHVSPDSPLASRIRNLLNNRKKKKLCEQNSRTTKSCNVSTPSNSSCVTSSRSTSSPTNSGNSTSSVDSLSPSCEKIQDSSSSVDSLLSSGEKIQDSSLFDDAYKPDMSSFRDEFDIGRSRTQSGISLGLEQALDHRFPYTQDQLIDLSKNVDFPETNDLEFSEFERMKVERQISASLYAMNGVQEYMETVLDPIEALWDLPPLCSLLS